MVDRLLSAARSDLQGCSRVLIFDGAGRVLLSTFEGVSEKDMQSLTAAVAQPREQAIRNGLLIQGRRYEVNVDGTMIQSITLLKGVGTGRPVICCMHVTVHQHHPPLVWGRSMQGDPESSTGAAVYQGIISGTPVYVAVTFELPATTAHVVAHLSSFCRKYCPAG